MTPGSSLNPAMRISISRPSCCRIFSIPSFIDKVKAGEQPRNPGAVGCPAFKAIGQEVGLLLEFGSASCSSLFQRDHLFFMDPLAEDEPACALGPVEALVSGKGEEIDSVLFHVDGTGARCLRRIDQEKQIVFPA